MDKYAHRRSALKRLVDGFGHGGISRVATKIGKEPNYVSRMLYPDDKPGRKRIGEDSAELLSREFPGWLEELAGTGATGEQDYLPDLVLVDEAHHSQPTATVFEVKEPQAQFGFTAAPTCESALVSLSHTLDRITPLLQDAGRSAVMKWLHGEASASEVARTIEALVEASSKIEQKGSNDKVPEVRIHQTAQ